MGNIGTHAAMHTTADGPSVTGLFQNSMIFEPKGKRVPSRIIFDLQKSYSIYGMKVAIQSLLRALFQHSKERRFEVFTMPQRLTILRASLDGKGPAPVTVHSYHDLLKNFESYKIGTWFDPAGNFWTPSYLRRIRAQRIFPITALHHTVSYQTMLSNVLLQTLVSQSYSCDSLICASQSARRALETLIQYVAESFRREFGATLRFEGRMDVIPLGIDIDVFCPRDKVELRKQLGLPEEACILLCFGRISVVDKADLLPLLRIFKVLKERQPAQRLLLIIAGGIQGTLARCLAEQIQGLGLNPDVRLMLGPDKDSRHLLFAASDIFVSPADNVQETFGLTNLEAMACGIPQVVTDWDGYRETVEHGRTGFLVPTYWARSDAEICELSPLFQGDFEFEQGALSQSVVVDTDKYCEYLEALVTNSGLRYEMSAHSRQRATHLYAWGAIVEQYEALWRELSAIAISVEPQAAAGPWFAQPSYFDAFKHYATSSLQGDQLITTAPMPGWFYGPEKHIIPAGHSTAEYGWLSEELLVQLMHLADLTNHNHLEPGHSVTVGLSVNDLVDAIGPSFSKDAIRRHVLWLLKYGFLQIV
jgi:D-inositol-3-phosphate glycosyltransferase